MDGGRRCDVRVDLTAAGVGYVDEGRVMVLLESCREALVLVPDCRGCISG